MLKLIGLASFLFLFSLTGELLFVQSIYCFSAVKACRRVRLGGAYMASDSQSKVNGFDSSPFSLPWSDSGQIIYRDSIHQYNLLVVICHRNS